MQAADLWKKKIKNPGEVRFCPVFREHSSRNEHAFSAFLHAARPVNTVPCPPLQGAAGARAKNVAGNLASVVKAARSKGPITAEGLLTPEAMQQLAAAQQAATKVGVRDRSGKTTRRLAF